MAENGKQADILNSWKEISSFLQRGVRTVQRWEEQYNLPVHRLGTGPRSPVFAIPAELKYWLLTIARTENGLHLEESRDEASTNGCSTRPALARSHELRKELGQLMQEHHKRAEILHRTVLRLSKILPQIATTEKPSHVRTHGAKSSAHRPESIGLMQRIG